MSKSSTASATKTPTQLPTKSAWAKGPPPNTSNAPSPRSQSPAPTSATPPASATHSRRPSTLGQGVPVKDGVSVLKGNVGSVKQSSSPVTFGSIDDAAAPISSSPATAPAIKPSDGGVKSFGSVPAASGHVNGKASISSTSSKPASTPSKPMKMDIAKFFQGSSSSAPSPSDTASPSVRTSALPQQQQPHHQQSSSSSSHPSGSSSHPPSAAQSQPGPPSFQTFVPGNIVRSQPQNSGPPRSPVYSRQMQNGAGQRPPGGHNGPPPPMSAGLSSPRLGTHPHPVQASHMAPAQIPWNPYYYPPDPQYIPSQYSPGWYGQPLPPHQPPHHPHPHTQPSGPPGPLQHNGMSMSPRNPPPPLQGPGTPAQQHNVPLPGPIHSPHPTPSHAHTHSTTSSISVVSSPPPTPSTNGAAARLNTNASAFVPSGRSSRLTIKNPLDGTEVTPEQLKKSPQQPGSPAAGTAQPFSSPGNRRSIIRMESEEDKNRRLKEEQAKSRALDQAKKDADEKAKKEAELKAKKQKEEEDKKKKEAAAEQERIRKEEEEKERARKEEEDRLRKEEEEKERLKQEEARKKEEEAEKLRLQKEAEEAEALRKEEEEKAKQQARLESEEKAKAAAAEVEAKAATQETEEGEVVEKKDEPAPAPAAAAAASTENKEKSKENLRIDTAISPLAVPRRRPGNLDLTDAKVKKDVPAALPSALATARHIDDLTNVPYPEGVNSPKLELNVGAKDGKFRYDRDFLLQFMSICKEKPDMLPPLDAIGLEPSDQPNFPMSRGGSGRHRQSSNAMPPPPSRQNSIGLGIIGSGSFGKAGASNPFTMGNFGTPGGKMSSEERFALANNGRVASVGGPGQMPYGRPSAPMVRSASQGGAGSMPANSNRTRSKRGEKRTNENKVGGGGHHNHQSNFNPPSHMGSMQNMSGEPVAPLTFSENRWTPAGLAKKPQAVDQDSPEIVDRKVKGLLNKLTMEKFDSISDQIIAWANKSEKEKDGRTLIQVIRLVFEKATDEAAWSEMYARLCRKMMEQISPKVQDDGIKNAEGKPIAGGQLFRKYLLNRCQEDFEHGWVAKETTAAAAATKATEDKAAQAANDSAKGGKDEKDESALYSDEYYAAQKAKRQGLGLIKFIGELFKLQMLTERIMHECVKKLLGNVENPEEEEIESLCQLIATVGSLLDTTKARAHMDVYFSRMKELARGGNVSSRMQFMLQDVIELRERKWIPRNAVAAPSTIAQIHEAAAKEKALAEKESYNRQMGMSRGGSRRGNDRGGGGDNFQQVGPDGWAVAGGSGPPRPPAKAGDLSQFGKINKTQPMTFGPSSVFAGKKDAKGRESSLSRTSSSQNMFSMLSQNTEASSEAGPSAKAGTPEPAVQRRKLQLLPRSAPSKPSGESTPEGQSEDEVAESANMSEADAKKKIAEDSKEFFAVRNLDEAETYFANLPVEHRFRLVDTLVNRAIESKESDAVLVAGFFGRAIQKNLCSPATFEEGFLPTAEILDDIAIDAPKAVDLMAIMLKGAGLDKDDARRARIVDKSSDSEKLIRLLA
ncbi:hypothetical protein PLICRDRAFT_48580 [Plicaturopsis crispa FD-325 SS-3]|nr:hypothetical protein PLICRDRAFT_48580 [Plicaturopsis crispa FD-325 SS-3]